MHMLGNHVVGKPATQIFLYLLFVELFLLYDEMQFALVVVVVFGNDDYTAFTVEKFLPHVQSRSAQCEILVSLSVSLSSAIDDVTVGIHPAEVSRLVVYFSIGGLYEAFPVFSGAFQYPPIT